MMLLYFIMKLYNSVLFHRDLSWLRFNHRVLQEAADPRNPLYERLKFLAIYSSNLDEFFTVRVSDIRQIKRLHKPLRKKLITKPNKVLKEIKKQVDIQQEQFGALFRNKIVQDLKKEGIHLINHTNFSNTQKEIAHSYFHDRLISKLNLENSFHTKPQSAFVENGTSYLVSVVDKKLHLVKIPKTEPRFFTFPSEDGQYYITFIDDILKFMLPKAFHEDSKYYAIKVSRDAELYIEDEFSGNLKKKVEASLPKREKGQPTRVLVDQTMPHRQQEHLKVMLDVSVADLIQGGTYHNFKDFFSFPDPKNKAELYFEPFPALAHNAIKEDCSIFELIQKKDQIVHYPYQSFDPVIKLIETAAHDPKVTTIKMTLYRLASESRLNTAISEAAKKGKNVVVFIEVKARFDEENNMKWGAIFEESGVKVIYSFADIKVHSKIILIERQDNNESEKFAFISTGNFNEKTSKIYTDFGLMTANKTITKDLNKVFMVLESRTIVPKTKLLLVSPFSTRQTFETLIKKSIRSAEAGNEPYIILKMNSLQDPQLIKSLYKASNAGVVIRLIVRGICCLVPGIPNQSENIEIISIVDRFLEHSRVYIFGDQKEEIIYMGSADWMTRNLDHRIEVLVPILDKDIHQTLRKLIQIQLSDNLKARVIDAEQSNAYVKNHKKRIRSQYETYNFFKERVI